MRRLGAGSKRAEMGSAVGRGSGCGGSGTARKASGCAVMGMAAGAASTGGGSGADLARSQMLVATGIGGSALAASAVGG